jgi:hypothetical protein
MMKRILAVSVLVAGPAAWGDEVFLRGGGSIHGEVVQRTASSIVMEVGPGRMTLPMSRVDRIVATTSALSIYRDRAARLAAGDVAGWLRLARWAEGYDLLTQAREAYEHVAAVDPANAAANAALGRVQLAGQWVTREESYRARGLVSFEGRWVTPSEVAALVSERAAQQRSRELALEASARAREAEARARTAEAEARLAEAAAQGGSGWSGSDWGYGGGYGPVYGGGYGGVYGNGVNVALGAVHPYAATPYGYGGPYGGVYGPNGLRHAGSPGVGWPRQPVVTPHGSRTRPMRDGGGSRGSSAGRRH